MQASLLLSHPSETYLHMNVLYREPNWELTHHTHAYFQLIWVTEGTLLLVDPEEEYFPEEIAKLRTDVEQLGLGLAQLPDYMVAQELRDGSLVEVLPSLRPQAMPISVVYPSQRLVPLRVRVVTEAFLSLSRLGADGVPRSAGSISDA